MSFLAQPNTVILLLWKGEGNFWSSSAGKTASSQEVVGMLPHCLCTLAWLVLGEDASCVPFLKGKCHK